MNELVTRRSLKEGGKGHTDWKRIDNLSDADIDSAVAGDPDAAPVLDADWFADAELVLPERKQAISLRVDADVLRWYKAQGPLYLSRMNAILRQYAEAHGAALAGRSARAPAPG
ncbi:MAG: 3-oxoacyl-ACP synthase [Acetobacteraceae bacterium]|nr:3-oxoacyl-ACP synthase [Acetobacteraceae bacterium]